MSTIPSHNSHKPVALAEYVSGLLELKPLRHIPTSDYAPYTPILDALLEYIDSGATAQDMANTIRSVCSAKSNEGLLQELRPLLYGDPHSIKKKEKRQEPISIPVLADSCLLPYIPLQEVVPWVADYIKYSEEASPEGYKDYHLMGALFVLSTVAARRICIPLATPQYTNLTLVMCSRTSFFAKSTAGYAANKCIQSAGLGYLLGPDEMTPQKMLYDMAGHLPLNYAHCSDQQKRDIELGLAMSGQRGWYYDEFGQLVDDMKRSNGPMTAFAGLLRRLDNCVDQYRYGTKGGGTDVIDKPYLTLFASTTPPNMIRSMGKGAELWGDGTCARWIFGCPPPDEFSTKTMKVGIVPPPFHIVNQLQEFHQHLGIPQCFVTEMTNEKGDPTGKYQVEVEPLPEIQVTVSQQSYDAFERYRVELRNLVREGNVPDDLAGNYARWPIFGIRIAGLFACLCNNDVLDIKIWTIAQQIMEIFRISLHQAYVQTALKMDSDESPLHDIAIVYLKSCVDPITVREIIQSGPHELRRLKTEGVRKLMDILIRDGIVEMKRVGRKESYLLLQSVANEK